MMTIVIEIRLHVITLSVVNIDNGTSRKGGTGGGGWMHKTFKTF